MAPCCGALHHVCRSSCEPGTNGRVWLHMMMRNQEMIGALGYAAATFVSLVAALLCAWETGAPVGAALLMVAPALIATAAALLRAAKTAPPHDNGDAHATGADDADRDLGNADGVGRARW